VLPLTIARERAGFGDVFSVGEFRALWLAYLISVAGDQLALVSVTVLVYDRTKSPLLAALAYSAGFLPTAIGGVWLSRLADAYPRRAVMVTCDLTNAVLVAVMALPGEPIGVLVTLLACITLLASPFRAARSAMLPDILTGDRYVMGTATMQITNRIGRTSGFAVGGVVVAALGARTALTVDAATFLVSASFVRLGVKARPSASTKAKAETKQTQDTTDGSKPREPSTIRRVFADPRLRTLMLFGWLVPFYAVPEGVAVPYAHQLHGGSAAAGLILASGPAGAMVGTLAFSRLVNPERRLRLMGPLAVLTCGLLSFCFLAPPLAASLIIFAAATSCSAFQLATNATFVAAVPSSWRGRAFGLANAGITVGQSLWFAAAGAAASAISPAVVIGASGVIGAVVAATLAATWRRLPARDPA
jgi:MFS family permease